MQVEFENATLRSVACGEIPERFFASDIRCRFSLRAGKGDFGWAGIPGELYTVEAPLNATAWGEEYRRAFSHWRCAVFAPPCVETGASNRAVPLVFLFNGIGGDYCDTAIFLRKLMSAGDCIVVAFDTHLTGERNLVTPGVARKGSFLDGLTKMERDGCVMRNIAFAEAVEEMSFNVLQIRAFLSRRYCVAKKSPLYMLGFSLGGFYATQIALRLQDCKCCIGGGAAPDISLYSGLLFGAMRRIPEWLIAPFREIGLVAEIRAVKSVTKTPMNIFCPVSKDIEFYYVIGDSDLIVNVDSVRAYCQGRGNTDNVHVVAISGVGHEPGGSDALSPLGNQMVEALLQSIRRV